jgi:hypothetical protein
MSMALARAMALLGLFAITLTACDTIKTAALIEAISGSALLFL